jgi:hypothetical protein
VGVAFAFAAPALYNYGHNVVLNAYLLGVERMFLGLNPYLSGGPNADIFKYSPLFAILFYPLSFIPSPWLSLVWALINCGVYWWGINRFFRISELNKRSLLGAFIVLSLELNGTLRYQQVNALLVGLSLGGLSYFRDTGFVRSTRAGLAWMSLASNFKVLGLSLMGPLTVFAPLRWILMSGAWLVLPVLVFGFRENWFFHTEWLGRLVADTESSGLLDISTVLQRSGLSGSLAKIVSLGILAISAPLLLLLAHRLRQSQGKISALMYTYAALALSTVLLINPRTESPTFVMVAPAFWGMWLVMKSEVFRLGLSRSVIWLSQGMWWISFWMTSIVFNSIWPRAIYQAELYLKTYGLALLWLLVLATTLRLLRPEKKLLLP